jgi:acyl-CoA synthetase (AMP-forming)/AMP-acid ligase II
VLAAADPVAAFLEAYADGADVLLRTSGTSGTPRVVRRTPDSWVSSFPAVESLCGLTSSSRAWVPAPLHGTMNLFARVHAAHLGAEVVPTSGAATHWFVTPSAMLAALDAAPRHDGVVAVVAGDRLHVTLHDRAVAAGITVHHYYGATELSFVAWGRHSEDLRPFPGVAVDVRDGEIWARSPYLSLGYAAGEGDWRLADDGFATVGDRGRLVDDRLAVEGRDDVVVTGGATVRAADVEGSLLPAATGAVAVVGVAHPRLGAVVAVALEHVADLDVLRPLARSLDAASQPRRWYAVDPFPLTPAGKVDRAALGALVAAGGPGVTVLGTST